MWQKGVIPTLGLAPCSPALLRGLLQVTVWLQAGPRGLPASILPHAADDDGGACLSQGLLCNGKAPDPFPSFIALEKYELSRRELRLGWKSRVGTTQGEISSEEIKREEDCS